VDTDSLKTYVDQRFTDLEKRISQERVAAKEAVDLALAAVKEASGLALSSAKEVANRVEEAATERMANHNRLQEKLDEQGQRMAPKNWVEEKLQSLSDTARALEKRVDRIDERKVGMTLSVKIAVGIVAFAATLVGGAVSTLGLYFLVVKFMARSVGVMVP